MKGIGKQMISEKKLSNGITVIMEKIDYVQSVAVGIFFRAGAVDETSEKSGISHFIEHMMFKGTEKRSAKEIAEDVDIIGGNINAFTGKENTCYYIKTITENMEAGIEILADMINNSVFDGSEMEKEKNVVLEEMKMIEDTPDELSIDILGETVLKNVRTGKSIIGTKESVKSIKRDDIINCIDEYYSAGNMVISISGNMDIFKTVSILEKYFSGIKEGVTTRPKENYIHVPDYVYKHREIEQTHIALGNKGYAYEDKDHYAMILYSNILGGSMSSRLFQKVREEKGLAYTVQAFSSSYVDNGYFTVYAAVGHDKTEEAIEAIREELIRFKNDGVGENELKMTKEQIKGNFIFGQESVNKRMFTAGRNKLLLDKFISDQEVISKVENVTEDDIMRMAEELGRLEEYTAVILSGEDFNPEDLMKGKIS